MMPRHTLSESHVMEKIYYQAVDMASKPLRHAEQQRVHILDTDECTMLNKIWKLLSERWNI
jgi:hypothetical protein